MSSFRCSQMVRAERSSCQTAALVHLRSTLCKAQWRSLQPLASQRQHCSSAASVPQSAGLQARRCGRPAVYCQAAAAQQHAKNDAAEEEDFDGDVCLPPHISVDNDSHKKYSIVTIEVKGYPGMFRVIAWVLNGLMLDVQNATLHTDDDGIVTNKFWLTDIQGTKLSDAELSSVADRLTDYVQYCTPAQSARQAEKLTFNNVTVDNTLDDQLSVITIFAPQRKERLPRNALLEIASCINGCGIKINRAVIQSCSDCGVPIEEYGFEHAEKSGARLYRVWGTDRADKKLDYGRASALIYTLNMLYSADARSGSTTPPRPLV